MREGAFLDAMKSTMAKLAESALSNPNQDIPDKGFEYGRVCGLYQGLQMALRVAEEIIDREARDLDDDDDE